MFSLCSVSNGLNSNINYQKEEIMMNIQLLKKLIVTLIVLMANGVLTVQASGEKQSHSLGQFKRDAVSKEALKTDITMPLNESNTLKGLTRDAVKLTRSQKSKNIANKSLTSTTQNSANLTTSFYSFSIYSATSELIEDVDADGFYQTFSVAFDADINSSLHNDSALVYADLYLSKNGGPWELYFTTDNFEIVGDSEDDIFEVTTNLHSGYSPDHYDVLIDLYEVGFSDVVATYSADNTNALYALPIESQDYDPEYVEVEYYEEHSGTGIGILMISALVFFTRQKRLAI